jgi:hypothetical protein
MSKDPSEEGLGALGDEVRIMEGKPVPEIGIRDLDVEAILLLADEAGRLEPGLEALGIDLALDGLENSNPNVLFFFRFHGCRLFFHRYFNICGKALSRRGSTWERLGQHSISDADYQDIFCRERAAAFGGDLPRAAVCDINSAHHIRPEERVDHAESVRDMPKRPHLRA